MHNQPIKSLCPAAAKLLDEWAEGGTVLHVWVHEEARHFTVYTAVVQFPSVTSLKHYTPLRFYRLFPIMGKYQISCDREIYLEDMS
jgi:hypothetical protein